MSSRNWKSQVLAGAAGLIMEDQKRLEIEAATFRRLVSHLDAHKDVQNIDLMNLASFCRNCLSKWYRAEAEERGIELDYERSGSGVRHALRVVEGRVSDEATQAQLDKFEGSTAD